MKKQVAATKENRRNLRQRLMAALAMLLVAIILAIGTTYAWLTLSVAPEVSGIATNVGANGSLEIALLNGDTYGNPNSVKTPGIGESLAASSPEANERWGNLINLENTSYGLNNIVLYPARLNAVKSETGDGYRVGDKFLSVPTYGYDGRIVDLTDNTVAGTYNGTNFIYDLSKLDYGVRAIGTTNSLSVQASYLATAKGNISGYTNSAKNAAIGSFSGIESLLMKIAGGAESYTDADVATLLKMITSLQTAEGYIESALRQTLVAYAASSIADELLFNTAYTTIMDAKKPISQIVGEMGDVASKLPSLINDMITAQEQMKSDLANAAAKCKELTGNDYTAEQIRTPLNYLMNLNEVYFNDKKYDEVDKAELMTQMPITITLAPKSGVYASIADFTGNYQTTVTNMAIVKTASNQLIPHLTVLSMGVNELSAAGGGVSDKPIELTSTYGYALDLAFRCNAFGSDLLLETAGAQRVYDDSTSAATMGGGSYMEFATAGTGMGTNDMTKLVDAVRVAFIDNKGNILAVAKLNTSNRKVTEDGSVRAPLYLYEYEIVETGEDKGKLIMGERRKENNALTALDQNIAKAITTVVWLDGDVVDNTMVSATSSVSGVLNLQFASSVDLLPLVDDALKNYTVDKGVLGQSVTNAKTTYEAGQGVYTTESWTAFVAAYEYATKINNDATATPMQVNRAGTNLDAAQKALAPIDLTALNAKISAVREKTGKTTIPGAYVSKDNEVVLLSDGADKAPEGAIATFYRVDYNKNLHDEGNGFKTPIYTDESWSALAQALYNAEALARLSSTTPADTIDEAITALDDAFDGLERAIYYQPYDYEGYLYYKAITEATETYGKWYTNEFKRVVADITIVNLDAYAKKVSLLSMDGQYVSIDDKAATFTLELLKETYGSLEEQTIIADNWKLPAGLKTEEYALKQEDINKIITNVKADTFNFTELYVKKYPTLDLSWTSVAPGDYTVEGTMLTDKGVLFNFSKTLSFYKKAIGVTIEGATQILEGKTALLQVKLLDEGQTEEIANCTWIVDNAKVLSVDMGGLVKALFAGNANVSVTVTTVQGNEYVMEDSHAITVTYNKAEGVSLDTSSVELEEKKTQTLSAYLFGANHTEEIVSAEYKSSDKDVVSVSSNGQITANKAGIATITVTVKTEHGHTFTDTCTVTVTAAPEPEAPENPETPNE